MKPSDIEQAALSAIKACAAYLSNPEGAEERLRLDVAASNIADLFDMPDQEATEIRLLVLQAAVLARIVATRLHVTGGRQTVNTALVTRATATLHAALQELAREIATVPKKDLH